MKQFSVILLFCTSGLLMFTTCQLGPCSSKRFFIYNHEKIIESVKTRSIDFTEEDWKRKEDKMDQLARDCYPLYKKEMSDEEKKQFWMNYLHFNIKRHGNSFFKELRKDVKSWPGAMQDDLGVVISDPGPDLKKLMNEIYGKDIEKSIDDVIKGLEKIGEQIKEWLKEDE